MITDHEESDLSLKYGDKVFLRSSKTQENYYLAAKSVHSPVVYFLKENRPLNGIEHFYGGVNEMIFTITPRLYFESHETHKQTTKDDPKIGLYLKRKKVEDELNRSILSTSKGKPIRLGDKVQLFHPATGLYMKLTSSKSESGLFNVMTLEVELSLQSQFTIKSDLTFRKDGSKIYYQDNFYFVSSGKTFAYPIDEAISKPSILQFQNGEGYNSFKNRKKQVEGDKRKPHCSEDQTLMTPIQAANMNINAMTSSYSNKFKAIQVDISDHTQDDSKNPSFLWGDTVQLSKLDESGLENWVFGGCNLASVIDYPLIKYVKKIEYNDLDGQETLFQIIPETVENMGRKIQFDTNNQVIIHLKHVLTGKFIYYDPKEEVLKMIDDYGKFYDHIESNKSKIASEYEDKYKQYKEILEGDAKDKDALLQKQFSPLELKLFNKSPKIVESPDHFVEQYLRDIGLVLTRFSQAESNSLQSSSYFSISTYSGAGLKTEPLEDKFDRIQSQQNKEIVERYFQPTFEPKKYYNYSFVTKSQENDKTDFFYFNSPTHLNYNPTVMDYAVSDMIRYLRNDEYNPSNLTSVNVALEFLAGELSKPNMTRVEFQNYIRENCLVDMMMKIFERIYRSELEHHSNRIKGILQKVIHVLMSFIHNNKYSAFYLYQWKPLFQEFLINPRLLDNNTELISLVSSIFENTGNYNLYLEYNLKTICNRIVFKNFDRERLKEFLSMLNTSKRMKNPLNDEYILQTVIFSENRDRIFKPFQIGEDGSVEVQANKAMKLTLDQTFVVTQEMECKYVIDLTNAAAVLAEMAPNRVASKMKLCYPKQVCLKIATDSSLSGELRGSFIKAYKSLYIMGEIPKYDLTNISSNILVDKSKVPYLQVQEHKLEDLRTHCFKNNKEDLLGLILQPFDTKNTGLTSSIMELSQFIISNKLIKKEEIDIIENNLKMILREKGVPKKDTGTMRKMSNKESLVTLMSINQDQSTEIMVSSLQGETWMPDLIRCLIEIELYKNDQRWTEFCLQDAVKLGVDFDSLLERYKDQDIPQKRHKLIKEDRKKMKNHMDHIQSSDLETPRILLELINPDKSELSNQVFKYLNLLLRRDELTLANFKYKFSLPKSLSTPMKDSFLHLYELTYRSAGEAFKLERAIDQKENSMVKDYFSNFVLKIQRILQKLFIIIKEGDRMKKLETNLDMYAQNEIEKDYEDYKGKNLGSMVELDGSTDEVKFYFNIMNHFLGHTIHYKYRRTIFIDLQLPVNILEVLLQTLEFIELHNTTLSSQSTDEKEMTFEIHPKLLEGSKFNPEFSKALVKCLLMLCYIFIKPSSYNKEYIKENHENISKLLKKIMQKGSRMMKLLYLKFMILVIKNNMSVLVKISSDLINNLFEGFEKSLRARDHQMIFAFLEIFTILVEFRGVNFVENSGIVSAELLRSINGKGSLLKEILMRSLPEWLKKTTTAAAVKKIDYLDYKWDQFYSNEREQMLMTREHKAKFDAAMMESDLMISIQIFSIYKVILQTDQPKIFEMVKNTFSLGYLLDLNRTARDWWPLKKVVIELVSVLYVNEKLSERNLDVLFSSLEKDILSDTQKFDKKTQNKSDSSHVVLVSSLESIISTPLEESCYKPYFGQIVYNKNESLKNYISNGVYTLLKKVFETMENSRFLEQKNFGVFKLYKKIFVESNKRNNKLNQIIGITRKINKGGTNMVERNPGDGFVTKFRKTENSDLNRVQDILNMMNMTKNHMLVYRETYRAGIIYNKIEAYMGSVDSEFESKGSGSEDMLQIKDEIISANFLDIVNDEDYNEYIDSILSTFYKDKTKWHFFLSDLISLLKPRNLTFEELERLINIIEGLIQRSQQPVKTIELLANMGLFTQVLQKYIQNKLDSEVCMLLAKFTILCANYGKQIAQEKILIALRNDFSNSYIVSVKENLASSFVKFNQRETLRASFIGREMLNQQLKHDLNGPIIESSDFFILHLEMLRYFCEGHYLPMQNYLREQEAGDKHMPNQVSFLHEVEEHLRQYSKIMSGMNTGVGLKILEFFVEMLQGPCYHNQLEVCKLKVIETLEEMCTTLIFYSYTLNEDIKSAMINQIVLILMSTLESNRDTLTISKVSLNVNTDALWERLIQVYCTVMNIEEDYTNPVLENFRRSKEAAKTLKSVLSQKNFGKLSSKAQASKIKDDKKKKKKALQDEKKKKKTLKVYNGGLTDYSSICYEGINISILFQLLMGFGEVPKNVIEKDFSMKTKLVHLKKLPQKAREFFFEKIKSIEIVNQKGELERIYYQIPAIVRFHSKYSKDQFEESVDRKSANSKLTGLLDVVPLTFYESKYFTDLSRRGISVNLNLVRNVRYMNFIWAFAVNLMMLIFDDVDNEQTVDRAFKNFKDLSKIEVVLFFITLFLACSYTFTLILWFILQFSVEKYTIILDEKENHNREKIFDFDLIPDELETEEEDKLGEEEQQARIKKEEEAAAKKEWERTLKIREEEREKNDIEDDGDGQELADRIEREEDKKKEREENIELMRGVSKLRIWYRIVSETYLFMLILFIVSTILGLTVSKIFLSFLLLDIISLSPDLKNVMKAFTMKAKGIGITFIFGIIQIFVYTSVTYYSSLRSKLVYVETDTLEMCENFFHCFMMTLNFGMRSGGGIGENVAYPQYVDNKLIFLFRTIFDMIFFLTIIIMLLEMIFGLIVDSFGELREIRTTTLNDMNSKCFICNIHQDVFSKQNQSFSMHREEQHNHWAYNYYLVGLLVKDEEEMNGVESYVFDKYKKEELSWLPVGRALIIQHENLEKDIEEKIEHINDKVGLLKDGLDKIGIVDKVGKGNGADSMN